MISYRVFLNSFIVWIGVNFFLFYPSRHALCLESPPIVSGLTSNYLTQHGIFIGFDIWSELLSECSLFCFRSSYSSSVGLALKRLFLSFLIGPGKVTWLKCPTLPGSPLFFAFLPSRFLIAELTTRLWNIPVLRP